MRNPAPGVYKHFKGQLYRVLGTCTPVADIPIHIELGTAVHSETGTACKVGVLSNLLVTCFDPYSEQPPPPIEPLVLYVGLYPPGYPPGDMFVRPVEVWHRRAEIKTAYGDREVERYELVR